MLTKVNHICFFNTNVNYTSKTPLCHNKHTYHCNSRQKWFVRFLWLNLLLTPKVNHISKTPLSHN